MTSLLAAVPLARRQSDIGHSLEIQMEPAKPTSPGGPSDRLTALLENFNGTAELSAAAERPRLWGNVDKPCANIVATRNVAVASSRASLQSSRLKLHRKYGTLLTPQTLN